jgi:hypothetical protein
MVRMRSPVRFRLEAPLIWPVGQVVKTPPFHGGNRGSSPLRVTICLLHNITGALSSAGRASALQAEGRRFDPVSAHHMYFLMITANTSSAMCRCSSTGRATDL